MTSGQLLADFSRNVKAVELPYCQPGYRSLAGEDPGTEFKVNWIPLYQYLDDLREGLRMNPGDWVGKYIAKAEALIELLEVRDCATLGLWGIRRGNGGPPALAALPRTAL